MKSAFKSPPVIFALVTLFIVMGVFIYVTDMPRYMTSSPRTCTNCHMMDAAYENWYHAPHQNVTKCVDCHLPHENVFSYYYVKFASGAHDVYYFSTGITPDRHPHPPGNERRSSNPTAFAAMQIPLQILLPMIMGRNCWDCHRDVAHGVRGITLLPVQDSIIYTTGREKRYRMKKYTTIIFRVSSSFLQQSLSGS